MQDEKKGASSLLEDLKSILAPVGGDVKMWENARFVLAEVPLYSSEVKKILPFGMRPVEPALATLFIADYTKTSFTAPYHEAAVLVHVRTPLGSGLHCPWMIVDDDTGLIYGRELLGYPKKFGQFTFEEKDGGVFASVSRRGIEVMKIEARRQEREDSPRPVFDYKTFNAGGPGQFFAIQPIWLFRPKEVIQESWSAQAKVILGESDFDPIAKLVSGPPLNARFVVMDILGSRYNLPVGVAGIRWFANTYNLRFR
ncbi:MAG TPA: acetoacetate decarboxylase family protein [bacterium]|nr:acetoacetate decarboxylase family protein [bacterium]